jgi:hypothetical protein
MESHSKHGDSIYWKTGDTLFVNLYIASELNWAERKAKIVQQTDYPFDDRVTLIIEDIAAQQTFDIALRVPAWCEEPAAFVNGEPAQDAQKNAGYLSIRRRWERGDTIELRLPRKLRIESTPDDPDTIALLYGPLVLAADLGAIETPYDAPPPALVGDDILAAFEPLPVAEAEFRTTGAGRPGDMTFRPFFMLRDRRTAVYFKRYTPAQWETAQTAFAEERRRLAELDARSVDSVLLGDEADEAAHRLESEISYPVTYRNRPGRDARTGGYFSFEMKADDEPLTLQATYWGGERERVFDIIVDGEIIASEQLEGKHHGEFFSADYPVPPSLTKGKRSVRVRFAPHEGHSAGPAFGVRLYRKQV